MSHAGKFVPRLIAWEVTRSCTLACKHCRAGAKNQSYPGELSTEDCYRLLDNIASFAKPIIILTGGEPMLRPDIYDIAKYAHTLGLPVVMAPCGMLIDDESAAKIVASGIKRISISLDGATAESHDAFRGVAGAFEGALRGIEAAKRAGLGFQINTTITTHNIDELGDILVLAVKLGAAVFNPFLLVPTGRGEELIDQELSPEKYEQTLGWLAGQQSREDIKIRVTCAPHYQRILRQRNLPVDPHQPKGCMGGQSFAFISHRGKVQICGFLDVECGDVRAEDMNFRGIWETSEVLRQIRNPRAYAGRCGVCEFAKICGGCRARAFAVSGSYMAEEPFCTHQPRAVAKPGARAELADLDKRILSVIQTDFPVAQRPFDVLAGRLGGGAEAKNIATRIRRLRDTGVIRRIGAVFDSAYLGYASALVAAKVPPDRVDELAALVNELPGVTHNYGREHLYNLWFTLTAQSTALVDAAIADMRGRTGIADFSPLPAISVYKIRVDFDLTEDGPRAAPYAPPAEPRSKIVLDDAQKQLIRELQGNLPAGDQPLQTVADKLKRPLQQVIDQIEQWLAAGVIRRFGAVVRHQRLGFGANGMAVFNIPPGRIDAAGEVLAGRPDVSHCYRRPALPDFPYNLYAMVHGRAEDEVRRIVSDTAGLLEADAFDVLFSVKEYKKVSMRYFMD